MAQRKIDYKDYEQLFDNMVSYLQSCDERDVKAYIREIAKTGLFHDAFGKVVEIKESSVLIETEY